MIKVDFSENSLPLEVDEVVNCLRSRWKATYDIKLVVRSKTLYLQVMWAYLEQQSFPLTEGMYRENLGKVVDVVNRLGQAHIVRQWLLTTDKKPRVGKALSLKIDSIEGIDEFVL